MTPRPAHGTPGWFAPAALLAALLDAANLPGPGPLAPIRWLELAVFAGLVGAVAYRWNERDSRAWSTPLDGRIVAALAVLLLAAMPWGGRLMSGADLRIVLAGVAAYYTLSALVARDEAARENAWVTFPVAACALGLHALWAATSGLGAVAGAAADADIGWGARNGLLSAVLFATLLTLGRALERGAAPALRLATVVGAIGSLLHLAAVGRPIEARALARIEDPLGFSAAIVMVLVLHWLGWTSWTLRRERPAEAGRWWGAMAAVSLLGVELLFGAGTPGEGLVLLAVVCAALVVAAQSPPAAALPAVQADAPARLRRVA